MSLKEETFKLIKLCFDGYIKNKSEKESDYNSKKNRWEAYLAEIDKNRDNDEQLLTILIKMGHDAHQEQLRATYDLNYSRSIFATIHLIRSEVSNDSLAARIKKEMYANDEKDSSTENKIEQLSLSASRKRLVENEIKIHAGEETVNNLHANIDTKTLTLVFLGCFNPLFERYEVGKEMEQLYPSMGIGTTLVSLFEATKELITRKPARPTGYEFPTASLVTSPSDSYREFCKYIPSAWQPDFTMEYFKKHHSIAIRILSNSKRSIEDPTTNEDIIGEIASTPASSPLNKTPLKINTLTDTAENTTIEEKKSSPTFDLNKIQKTICHIENYLKLSTLIKEETDALKWLKEKLSNNLPWAEKIFAIGNKANQLQSNNAVTARCLEIFYLAIHSIRSETDPSVLQKTLNKKRKELGDNRAKVAAQVSKSTQKSDLNVTYQDIHDNIKQLGYLGDLAPYSQLKNDKKAEIYPSIPKKSLYSKLNPSDVLQDKFIEEYQKKYAVDYLLDRATLFEELLRAQNKENITREIFESEAREIEVEINTLIDSDQNRVGPLKARLTEWRENLKKLSQKQVTTPSSHALVSTTLQQTPSTVVVLGSTQQPEQKQEEKVEQEENNKEQDEEILGEFLDQQKWGSDIPENTRVKTFLEKSDHRERLNSMWGTFIAQKPGEQDVEYFDPVIKRYTNLS